MEHVYIVLWRLKGQKWQLAGTTDTEEKRDLLLSIVRIDDNSFEYAWVEGPLFNPAQMAEAERQLGAF